MQQTIAAICSLAGAAYLHHERVNGGDINAAYKVSTATGNYFLKINVADKFPAMFLREAEGLKALGTATMLRIPAVVKTGEYGRSQFLVLEWLERGEITKDFWQQLAGGLAQMHQTTSPSFGWAHDNYIGSLTQSNKLHSSWAAFYANERLLPLCRKLVDSGAFTRSDMQRAEAICKKLPAIFPEEKPALLHGDLWSGNYMVTNAGPAIYDPAVCFGHREMDIAMTKLFGGFATEFYRFYHESFPLENGWQQRVTLAQSYPLLVHAVLFGGGYVYQCREIMQAWS